MVLMLCFCYLYGGIPWDCWMSACQNGGQNNRHVFVALTCCQHVGQHVGNMAKKAVGRGTTNVRPTCRLLTCPHHVGNMLAAKATAMDYHGILSNNGTQQSNSKLTRGERHWQWHQQSNSEWERGERDERRLRGLTTRATTMRWIWLQWHLRKKVEAVMAVAIIDCAALWRWSMVAAAMAVIIAGSGSCCKWWQWGFLLMATARADMGKGGQGRKGEGVPTT